MMLYQVPSISTIKQEPFQSYLQYQPNCSVDACGESLGISYNGCCPDELQGEFFLPGRTDLNAPTGCIIVGQDCSGSGITHNGGGCSYFLEASCAEGQVWAISCSFPGNPFNTNGFGTAFISCDGELSTVCSGGGC